MKGGAEFFELLDLRLVLRAMLVADAPQRIEQTRLFIRSQLIIMGVVHLLLAVLVMQLAIQANFSPGSALHESIVWLLLVYFVFLGAWLIRFFLRFRKP